MEHRAEHGKTNLHPDWTDRHSHTVLTIINDHFLKKIITVLLSNIISIFLFATRSLKHALSRYCTHKSNASIRKYCDIFVLGSMGLAIFWIFYLRVSRR